MKVPTLIDQLASEARAQENDLRAAAHAERERYMVHPDLAPVLIALGFRVDDGPEGKVFEGTRKEWSVALSVSIAHGLLVAAEREACAKVAESCGAVPFMTTVERAYRALVAAAIRARK